MITADDSSLPTPINARTRRVPIPFRDKNGTAMVRVEVPGMGAAEIEREHFTHIVGALGLSDQWFSRRGGRHRYVAVATNTPGGFTPVAHLIVPHRPSRKHVRYRDHDPLNLRLDNLRIADTVAKSPG